MPVDQQKIEDRIVIAVKRAKRTGATLAVNVESTNILAKHPDSPFSKEEIEAKLVRMALNENVPLQIGQANGEWARFQSEQVGVEMKTGPIDEHGAPSHGKNDTMFLSPATVAHMSSLADELAKSGNYRGWAEIEFELRDRGYPDAEHWLFNPLLRRRLTSMCEVARGRRETETQSPGMLDDAETVVEPKPDCAVF